MSDLIQALFNTMPDWWVLVICVCFLLGAFVSAVIGFFIALLDGRAFSFLVNLDILESDTDYVQRPYSAKKEGF